MKKTLLTVVVLAMSGSAYAADFSDFAINIPSLKVFASLETGIIKPAAAAGKADKTKLTEKNVEAMKDSLLAAVKPVAAKDCFTKSASVKKMNPSSDYWKFIETEKAAFKKEFDYAFQDRDPRLFTLREVNNADATKVLSSTYLGRKKLEDLGVSIYSAYNFGFVDRAAELYGADLFIIHPAFDSQWVIVLKTDYCES